MNALAPIPTGEARLPKKYWVTDARLNFTPSPRQACRICGRYESLTQAHHIIPLADQYAAGFAESDDRHVWLCPSHHSAVHLMLSQMKGKRLGASPGIISLLNELSDAGEHQAVLNLATQARLGREGITPAPEKPGRIAAAA